MNNNYKLSVNNATSFEFTESDSLKNSMQFASINQNFTSLNDSKPYQAEIISTDFIAKKYTVKVNNNTYEVAISNRFR